MQLVVLPVGHRVAMGLAVIQFSVEGAVIQVIVMPVMVSGGPRVTKGKLSLGRRGE